MTDEKCNSNRRLVDKLIDILLGLPWPEVLKDAWKLVQKAIQTGDRLHLIQESYFRLSVGLEVALLHRAGIGIYYQRGRCRR